jgi:hypothetical protein
MATKNGFIPISPFIWIWTRPFLKRFEALFPKSDVR